MSSEVKPNLQLEIGHVLFIDIVGYSKLLIDDQRESQQQLNQFVRETQQFHAAEGDGKLVRLPTGDGMALVFFSSAEAPIQWMPCLRAAAIVCRCVARADINHQFGTDSRLDRRQGSSHRAADDRSASAKRFALRRIKTIPAVGSIARRSALRKDFGFTGAKGFKDKLTSDYLSPRSRQRKRDNEIFKCLLNKTWGFVSRSENSNAI